MYDCEMDYSDGYRPPNHFKIPAPEGPLAVNRDDSLPSLQSRLCDVCRDLNLSIHDFVLQSKGGEMSRPVKVLGFYDEIVKRAFCPLCRLVVRAMSNGPTPLHQLHGEVVQDGTFLRRRVSLETKVAGGTVGGSVWPYVFWLLIRTEPDSHNWSFLVLFADSLPADFPNDLCARPLTPLVNVNLLRQWLNICNEYHRWCNDSLLFQPECEGELSAFRIVDVLQKRIVRIHPSEKYTALSYVWGTSTGFQATKSNMSDLEHECGLRKFEKSIPRTVRDAMRLVEDLGERYLWIDSLCLMQDDEEDLHDMMRKMDLVYGHSYFTIIAASGKDAEAGLPGLQLERQGILQYAEEIKPGLKVAVCEHLESHLLKSVYETRAWTYAYPSQYLVAMAVTAVNVS